MDRKIIRCNTCGLGSSTGTRHWKLPPVRACLTSSAWSYLESSTALRKEDQPLNQPPEKVCQPWRRSRISPAYSPVLRESPQHDQSQLPIPLEGFRAPYPFLPRPSKAGQITPSLGPHLEKISEAGSRRALNRFCSSRIPMASAAGDPFIQGMRACLPAIGLGPVAVDIEGLQAISDHFHASADPLRP